LPLLVESILTQGVADGSFDPTIDIRTAAMNIGDILRGLCFAHLPEEPTALGNETSVEKLSKWHVTFILRGLGLTMTAE
jgi:hypothetical protein